MTVDDMELIRGLGRDLEHEPRPSLARQRERLLKAGERPRRRRWPGRWPMLGVVAAVTAAAVLVPALLFKGGGKEADPVAQGTRTGDGPSATNAFNLLLIGADARSGPSRPRSDTLMLLHVPEGRGSVRVVSLPRDLLVEIPRCEGPKGKALPARRGLINSAFTHGGATCTVKTVESLTDVRIDRSAVLDFAGFAEIVNALGGVEVALPHAVDDPKSGLSLPAGRHRLNGKQALAYVRVRHGFGDGSDLGRIERQQRFLTSMAKEIAALGKDPAGLAQFLKAVAGAAETNPELDARGLLELARSMAKVGADDVRLETVPVVPAPTDRNRLVLDEKPARTLFSQLRSR